MPVLLDQTRGPEAGSVDDGPDRPRPRRTLSLTQAAEHFYVSKRTIYNRIREGKLQTIQVYGSQRVVLD